MKKLNKVELEVGGCYLHHEGHDYYLVKVNEINEDAVVGDCYYFTNKGSYFTTKDIHIDEDGFTQIKESEYSGVVAGITGFYEVLRNEIFRRSFQSHSLYAGDIRILSTGTTAMVDGVKGNGSVRCTMGGSVSNGFYVIDTTSYYTLVETITADFDMSYFSDLKCISRSAAIDTNYLYLDFYLVLADYFDKLETATSA